MAKTKSEIQKAYEARGKHPCPQCGHSICRRSKICPDCYRKARAANKKLCVDCGQSVKLYNAQRCRACSNKHIKALFASGERHIEPKFGKAHHNWKSGVNRQKGGYILILRREHPRANRDGYVREHIIVWETVNKKLLPDGWIIHHLNGVKHDNRIRNLVALPNKKHYLVLQAKAKRIQELEALLNGQGQLL